MAVCHLENVVQGRDVLSLELEKYTAWRARPTKNFTKETCKLQKNKKLTKKNSRREYVKQMQVYATRCMSGENVSRLG